MVWTISKSKSVQIKLQFILGEHKGLSAAYPWKKFNLVLNPSSFTISVIKCNKIHHGKWHSLLIIFLFLINASWSCLTTFYLLVELSYIGCIPILFYFIFLHFYESKFLISTDSTTDKKAWFHKDACTLRALCILWHYIKVQRRDSSNPLDLIMKINVMLL